MMWFGSSTARKAGTHNHSFLLRPALKGLRWERVFRSCEGWEGRGLTVDQLVRIVKLRSAFRIAGWSVMITVVPGPTAS
jgi:hypothetical protein